MIRLPLHRNEYLPMSRSNFLTFLCIVTFINSGFQLFQSAEQYQKADIQAEQGLEILDDVRDQMDNGDLNEEGASAVDQVMSAFQGNWTPVNLRGMAISSILTSLLCIIGAVMMWGLQKRGYWVYAAGIGVSVLGPLVVFGGILGISQAFIALISGAIFLWLYRRQWNQFIA